MKKLFCLGISLCFTVSGTVYMCQGKVLEACALLAVGELVHITYSVNRIEEKL